MKTPITDAAAQTITIDCDDSCVQIYVYESNTLYEGELVPAFVSRRLETDRAALMEALETIFKASIGGCSPDASDEFCDIVLDLAENALSSARANFPNA
jgi:hypothetical protein